MTKFKGRNPKGGVKGRDGEYGERLWDRWRWEWRHGILVWVHMSSRGIYTRVQSIAQKPVGASVFLGHPPRERRRGTGDGRRESGDRGQRTGDRRRESGDGGAGVGGRGTGDGGQETGERESGGGGGGGGGKGGGGGGGGERGGGGRERGEGGRGMGVRGQILRSERVQEGSRSEGRIGHPAKEEGNDRPREREGGG